MDLSQINSKQKSKTETIDYNPNEQVSPGNESSPSTEIKRKYLCTICQRNFGQMSHLKYHFLTHTGIRPYVCSWSNCEKTFRTVSEFKRHYKGHTGENNLKCPKCKKSFLKEEGLARHISKHDTKENEVNTKPLISFTTTANGPGGEIQITICQQLDSAQ